MRPIYLLSILLAVIAVGCSGSNNNPLLPLQEIENRGAMETTSSHTNWGLWQFTADPETKTLDVIMLRTGAMHLNALPFIDQPPLVYLSLESLEFNGDIIDVGIGLRHPFLGLTEFTGFDVKGIFITNGSFNSFTDADLIMATDGDTRLLNPDGLTRWWNPSEFPNDGTIFGYMDGALGTPDSHADYNCTLNAYKYFCDDLDDIDDPMSDIDPEGRGVFSPGMKNVRHYSIQLGDDGLVFNYAVDASWQFPQGAPPWEAPGDFAEEANQPEAYRIEVTEVDKTLYYDETELEGSGGVNLSIDVYDWFGADLHAISVEWPGFAGQEISSGPTGGGTGYSTYSVELTDCTPGGIGEQPLLITVECEVEGYGDIIPGEPVSAYFIYNIDIPPGSGIQDPPDICTGWGDETGCYMHWQNGQYIHWIFMQFNFASDSQGNVWMWCHRTSNALSRSLTAFNGDWGTMYEEYLTGSGNFWIFAGSTIDVSLTPTFDGGLIAGCSPMAYNNPLSIAWWDGTQWRDKNANQWRIYDVLYTNQIARRINGYRDSTGRFHAFCHIDGEFIDYYGDTWKGSWEFTNIGSAPTGQADYACQTRTDFVAESSDGYIYVCWVDNGIKVARCQAGTTTWNVVYQNTDTDYDSPTIYIDNQDRLFLAARYFVSNTEDRIHLFVSDDGLTFDPDPIEIFAEAGSRVDPCYLTLKGDAVDHLFLTFPYRPTPSTEGAYAAIIASKPGGEEWTDVCVLSDPIISHPGMAIRPDGSIEVGYGIPYSSNPSSGSTDNQTSAYLYGRSHPGFVD